MESPRKPRNKHVCVCVCVCVCVFVCWFTRRLHCWSVWWSGNLPLQVASWVLSFPGKEKNPLKLLHKMLSSSCNRRFTDKQSFSDFLGLCVCVCVCSDLCGVVCLRCDGPLAVVMLSTDHLWNTDVTVAQWSATVLGSVLCDCCATVVSPSRGSLVRPSWLMMYRGMSVFIRCPCLAWSSAASSRW